MFTTSCYIRKDTPELITKLEELGYKYVHQNKGDALSVYDGGILRLMLFEDETVGGIDCGTNEELFLAIAALRDDSDIDQWFVHNTSKQFIECIHDEFHSCAIILGENNEYLGYNDYKDEFHKATIEELIEHFKNEDYISRF